MLEQINLVKEKNTKINIQRSVTFLCTNNEVSLKEISKIIPSKTATKR
jgi:hypothetical protein